MLSRGATPDLQDEHARPRAALERAAPMGKRAVRPELVADCPASESPAVSAALARETVDAAEKPLAAVTVDLEDWPVAVLGPHHAISERVVANTHRTLDLLRRLGVRGTFFVLGRVAEKHPELVRLALADGHEIASHGYGHELLTTLTPQRFRDDVCRSVDILAGITGARPAGYRAPAFSIVEATRWAGPILCDLGFAYDSSIFPIRHPRYGIPSAPRGIHRWADCPLVECPPATVRWGGRTWPVAGGGYFRLLPGAVIMASLRRLGREGLPAVLYMHPYELDAGGVAAHRRAGVRVGWRRAVTQEAFRGRVEARLSRVRRGVRAVRLGDLVRGVEVAASAD